MGNSPQLDVMNNFKINPGEYSILICNEEESVRTLLSDALKSWGFQTSVATSAEAAIEYFKTSDRGQILLIDSKTGANSRIDLAEKVKEIFKDIEVICISKPLDKIEGVKHFVEQACERIRLKNYSAQLASELKQKDAEVEALAKMASDFESDHDLTKTIDIGCKALSEAFKNCPTVFFQFMPGQKALAAKNRYPADLFAGTQPSMLLPDAVTSDYSALVKYFGELRTDSNFKQLLMDASKLGQKISDLDFKKVKFLSLVTKGIPRGLFVLINPDWIDGQSESTVGRYLQSISMAFENCLLHTRVLRSSIHDNLTGLNNARFFNERIAQELELATRNKFPLSVMFFDVDNFKKYNDAHGQEAGNQILKQIGEIAQNEFRKSDLLARFEGNKFVILFSHTAYQQALEKAEKFRAILESATKVTASFGVSECPSHGSTMQAVIKAAADALDEAKKRSKNVVVGGIAAEGYVPAFKVE